MSKIFLIAIAMVCLGASEPSDRLADRLYEMPRAQHAPSETDDEYMARMIIISKAVHEVDKRWQPYVMSVFINETRLAVDVHRGERGHYGSDGGRAKCMGQIHRHNRLTVEEWTNLGGEDLEATIRCAKETAAILSRGANMCKVNGEPGRVFDVYGKGSCTARISERNRAARLRTLADMRKFL